MGAKALLIDVEWCSGCHSCEMACQMEHGMPVGQTGILVNEIGPWEYAPEVWQLSYLPALTDQCDGCAERVSAGKLPTCVHHCQAKCMAYGTVEELSELMGDGGKKVLYTLTWEGAG